MSKAKTESRKRPRKSTHQLVALATGDVIAIPPVAPAPREMPPAVRLRERGPRSLSDAELIEILLGRQYGESVEPGVEKLLDRLGGIHGLADCDLEITRAQNIADERALFLLAALDLARRLRSAPDRPLCLTEPQQITEYLATQFRSLDQQVLGAFFADAEDRSLGFVECYRGTSDAIRIETRQVLREALCRKARSVLVFWFRPTLEPRPEAADFVFCRQLAMACECMDLELLDVLIFSCHRWQSLRRLRPW